MKTLKENTIRPKGICSAEYLNIFNISDPIDKDRHNYVSLSKMPNRRIFVEFIYEEDGTEKEGKIRVVIPSTDDEAIKDFIISEINNELNKQ